MIRRLARGADRALFEPAVIGTGPPRGRPPTDLRMLGGGLGIARARAPRRDLPPEAGPWGSVDRQVRRWTLSRLSEPMPEAPNAADGAPERLQLIGSAHPPAAGARGAHTGLRVPPPPHAPARPRAGAGRPQGRGEPAMGTASPGLGRSRAGLSTGIRLRTNGAGPPAAAGITGEAGAKGRPMSPTAR